MEFESSVRKTALVTGGASGIGAALGAALVRKGIDVMLADVDEAGLARTAQGLSDSSGSGRVTPVVLDVRDALAVGEAVTQAQQINGRLDYLFNNAGIGVGGEPDELPLDHWNRAIDVNIKGVIHGCHAAYPLMKQQGFGHIVNTASLAGVVPVPGQLAAYSMTKFAVVGLSLALRSALVDTGVQVHVVCPGFVDTPILDKRGPEDLPTPPALADRPTLRASLATRKIKLYPVARLADDVIAGVERNQPLIVTPRSAHLQWLMWRLAPELSLRFVGMLTRTGRGSSWSIAGHILNIDTAAQ